MDLSCGEYDVISLYFKYFLLMYQVVLCVACLTVFMNYLMKQFAICLGVVVILLLNVLKVFSVDGGAPLDRPWLVFQRIWVLCL